MPSFRGTATKMPSSFVNDYMASLNKCIFKRLESVLFVLVDTSSVGAIKLSNIDIQIETQPIIS